MHTLENYQEYKGPADEHYYEEYLIPCLEDKIKELEAKILEFYIKLRKAFRTGYNDEAGYWQEEYKEHFAITEAREGKI